MTYLYWRLLPTNKNNKDDTRLPEYFTYLQITVIVTMGLLIVVHSLGKYFFDYNLLLDNGYIKPMEKGTRYYKIPLLIAPFYVAIFLYFKVNKDRLRLRYEKLSALPSKQKNKYNIYFYIFLIMIVLGMVSSTSIGNN